MHFDPRTQNALRETGFDQDDLQRASELVVAAVEEDAAELESFFDSHATLYSDMEMAHSATDVQEHDVEFIDLFTHGGDLRGYLRFDSWGVPVEDGRPLTDEMVELSLGPTVHARVRFAADPETL